LSDHGVKLLACQNAMKNRNVATEDLLPFADQMNSYNIRIVDSGTEKAYRFMPVARDEETRPPIVRARPD
jgi:intracellular sulfur oxidation DsrE/DsrF family protein